MAAYDKQNIFAKILRGEIPCKKVCEDEYSLAFLDINPQAPVHILVIPKGEYISLQEFTTKASDPEIASFMRIVSQVARDFHIVNSGYRILSNNGDNANQEVPHFHVHVLGGKNLGQMIETTK